MTARNAFRVQPRDSMYTPGEVSFNLPPMAVARRFASQQHAYTAGFRLGWLAGSSITVALLDDLMSLSAVALRRMINESVVNFDLDSSWAAPHTHTPTIIKNRSTTWTRCATSSS